MISCTAIRLASVRSTLNSSKENFRRSNGAVPNGVKKIWSEKPGSPVLAASGRAPRMFRKFTRKLSTRTIADRSRRAGSRERPEYRIAGENSKTPRAYATWLAKSSTFVGHVKEAKTTAIQFPQTDLISAGRTTAETLSKLIFPETAIRVTPIAVYRKLM